MSCDDSPEAAVGEGRGGERGPGATWKSIRHDEDVETTPRPFVLRQAFKL